MSNPTCIDLAKPNRHTEANSITSVASMTHLAKTPYILVPEVALLSTLPEHYRKRFDIALHLMHDTLNESLTWQDIANKSAISPSHFHRQFSQLFNETPGQYLSRIRLQYAVYLLFSSDDKSITDVAHQCGYSSSQALAKALKRDLNVTAKEIRRLIKLGTADQTSELLDKLAHPGESESLERQLAQSMPCELIWYPARGMKIHNVPHFDWDKHIEVLGDKCVEYISATPIAELALSWDQMTDTFGNWTVPEAQFDFFIPAGYYLCSEVYLNSEVAYDAAIEALFERAETLGYAVNEEGLFIELVRELKPLFSDGATFSFQIPIFK